MSTTTIPGGTIWVCVDCMILAANGDMPDDVQEGEPAPWALWPDNDETTMGMLFAEHSCDAPGDEECDCEHDSFSWRTCEGCGSRLGGDRYAFTYWTPVTEGDAS